jgi:hypothetical protein
MQRELAGRIAPDETAGIGREAATVGRTLAGGVRADGRDR